MWRRGGRDIFSMADIRRCQKDMGIAKVDLVGGGGRGAGSDTGSWKNPMATERETKAKERAKPQQTPQGKKEAERGSGRGHFLSNANQPKYVGRGKSVCEEKRRRDGQRAVAPGPGSLGPGTVLGPRGRRSCPTGQAQEQDRNRKGKRKEKKGKSPFRLSKRIPSGDMGAGKRQ